MLAHAARKVVECAADLLNWPVGKVARAAGIPLLLTTSVKRALDIEWSEHIAAVRFSITGLLLVLAPELGALDLLLFHGKTSRTRAR